MYQSRRVIPKKKRNKNNYRYRCFRGSVPLNKYIETIEETNKKIENFSTTITSLSINYQYEVTSRIDAFRMQMDSVHSSIVNLNNSVHNFNGLRNTMESQIGSYSNSILAELSSIRYKALELTKIIEDFNSIVKNPVINETIEDLTTIANRFDQLE